MARVDLARKATEVMHDLPDDAHEAVIALIDHIAENPAEWPPAGSWHLGEAFSRQGWITYIAHVDGIEIMDVGWTGGAIPRSGTVPAKSCRLCGNPERH